MKAIKIILACCAHAIFMMLICILWLSTHYNLGIEKSFIQASTIIKRTLLNDTTNYSKDFVFLDIAKTKKLIPDESGLGVNVITDRGKLDSFFRIVNKVSRHDYQYILCDVLFDQRSEDDEKLQNTFNNTRKIIIPFSQNEDQLLQPVLSNTEVGYVGYNVSSGIYSVQDFLKYELIRDKSMKGISVKLFEKLNNAEVQKSAGFAWINGKPALNNIVLDLRIRHNNVIDQKGNTKILPFEEVLGLLSANDTLFYQNILSNKIILIGDYENDLHQTALGNEPGPLILADVYLSLKYGDARITLWWLLYTFTCFSILSWIIFYRRRWIEIVETAIKNVPLLDILLEITLFILIIWVISLVSYIWLDHYIDILILVIYLETVSSVIKFITRKNSSKR